MRPLGILESTANLVHDARYVTIDAPAIDDFVASFGGKRPEPTVWDTSVHFHDSTPDRVAGWIFALDALNFCFWSATEQRWRVTWRDRTHDGYMALAAALSRAVDEGYPLWEPPFLATLSSNDVAVMLRPDPGSVAIPLLDLRHRHLIELGLGFGSDTAADLVRRAGGSCIALIETVLQRFPSFRDVAIGPDGRPIHFYKRAQILVADLAGALPGTELGTFRDLHLLTAFADYKVPQVMRQLGILVYEQDLAARIERREPIPAGSVCELEIRAATVQGCELIRQALQRTGAELTASEIDWLLWTAGQSLPSGTSPYHRTLTPFY
jgi:hypothetical protein